MCVCCIGAPNLSLRLSKSSPSFPDQRCKRSLHLLDTSIGRALLGHLLRRPLDTMAQSFEQQVGSGVISERAEGYPFQGDALEELLKCLLQNLGSNCQKVFCFLSGFGCLGQSFLFRFFVPVFALGKFVR